MNKGLLIVVSAPSGCGKGTILEEVLKDKNYYYSVSLTTRKPREGEIDGVNYCFVSNDDFEKLISENRMLEYAEYCNNYYGTRNDIIEEMRENGRDVILEIEVQGALNVMKKCPDAISIFVLPPSVKELERRLRKRGTESDDVINQRLAKAIEEMNSADKYNYIVVNNALEDAIADFKAVIKAEKLKADYAKEILDEVIKNA
ncbi:MAG: guanylate kinase [Oscillospiraceae bacterium]|nr:guanylate kinase [Oscillospiraceae bacterium]